MAEEQAAAEGIMNNILPPDNIFVYFGGEQEVPADVTHVIIDRTVKIIPRGAFSLRQLLVSVVFHDGVEKIEHGAFYKCTSLRRLKMLGVVVVELGAFIDCNVLTDVEFGDKLETICDNAFSNCHSLRSIKIPTVRSIQELAFSCCEQLTDVELPAVETIGFGAFYRCPRLRRIVIPLRDNIFPFNNLQPFTQFDGCEKLSTVDLVGGIHSTISSLLLENWRGEMNEEINRINERLPNTHARGKAAEIRLWIRYVINRMEHYKAEHCALLKEDMTQLELALWKAKLDEKEEESEEDRSNPMVQTKTQKAQIDNDSMRKERRITSGASIVIKNVLPFLKLG